MGFTKKRKCKRSKTSKSNKTVKKTFDNEKKNINNNKIDVVIIGAGISGAYISYKLRKTNKYNIIIYEKNKYSGGRLLSNWEPVVSLQLPQIINESGGMRIFPSVHHRMTSLMEELNIKIKPHALKDDNAFVYIEDTNEKIRFNNLKGDYFKKLLNTHASVYPDDKNKYIYNTKLHTMSVNDVWDKYSKLSGLDKDDRKFWKNSLGYDNIDNISAAQWEKEINMLSTLKPTNQYLVKNGWQDTVSLLINNTKVKYDKELINIQNYNDYNILSFSDGSYVISKHVFITIPVTQLLNIGGLNKKNIINIHNNLINYPGTKTFLKFKCAWWKRDFRIKGGRSITSMNSRMIYYWDSDTILIYTAGKVKGNILNNIHKKYGIKTLINILIDELSISHYGKKNEVPFPIYATFKNWDMICKWWKPNADVLNLQKKVLFPCDNNKSIYYSNSNISEHQGWMEGSIEMADKALKLSNLL